MQKPYRSETRNVFWFFVLAFVFTWVFWTSEALASRGFFGSSIIVDFLLSPYNPAAWGPFISAIVLTYWYQKGKGVVGLLKKGLDYDFAKKWWIPTILLCPVIIGGAFLIAELLGETIPALYWLSNPSLILVNFVVILFTGGPLQEEFGWRGYALPRLQERSSALVSSIIIGFLWGLWHLPYFFIGTEITYAYGIIPQIFTAIMLSILLTWLFNNTGGSILVSLLFHTLFNLSNDMFPALKTQTGSMLFIVFFLVVVFIVVAVWGPKRLVREPKKVPWFFNKQLFSQ
jgi:membrane protease YdiL (CAAX protease family)